MGVIGVLGVVRPIKSRLLLSIHSKPSHINFKTINLSNETTYQATNKKAVWLIPDGYR
jgi:hypothetical protein